MHYVLVKNPGLTTEEILEATYPVGGRGLCEAFEACYTRNAATWRARVPDVRFVVAVVLGNGDLSYQY